LVRKKQKKKIATALKRKKGRANLRIAGKEEQKQQIRKKEPGKVHDKPKGRERQGPDNDCQKNKKTMRPFQKSEKERDNRAVSGGPTTEGKANMASL